jgi:diguanylate cyclase (GGDEF)-like protein
MSGYIGLMSATAAALQVRADSILTLGLIFAAVWLATAVLALPITWEFGQMYLELWASNHTLRELAIRDQQTGLLNNRSFIAAVEGQFGAGRRVALLLGDLDRFKSINDRHGHMVGDDVIAAVGTTARDLFGSIAVLGRMGGEEYAVMVECPFADPELAHAHVGALAEEFRRRVAEIAITTTTGPVKPTISIGIAYGSADDGFAALYARADKALYLAKSAGRDRVIHEDEIEAIDPECMLARRQDLYWRQAEPAPIENAA